MSCVVACCMVRSVEARQRGRCFGVWRAGERVRLDQGAGSGRLSVQKQAERASMGAAGWLLLRIHFPGMQSVPGASLGAADCNTAEDDAYKKHMGISTWQQS